MYRSYMNTRQSPQICRYNLFCAFDVFKSLCIYNYLLALFDEQGYLNAYAVVQDGWFAATVRNGLTLQGWFGFFDDGNYGFGQRYGYRLTFDKIDFDVHLGCQKFHLFAQ